MVGVCMVIISIVQILHLGGTTSRAVDKILGVDNVVFLLSALLSYFSMRYEHLSTRLEGVADAMFIGGLILMTLVSLLISFEIL